MFDTITLTKNEYLLICLCITPLVFTGWLLISNLLNIIFGKPEKKKNKYKRKEVTYVYEKAKL